MATNSTPDTATLIANTIANNKANPLYGNQALTPQQLQPVAPLKTVPVADTTSGLAGITASVGDQIAGDLGNIQNQIAQQEKLNQNQGNDLASLLLQQGNQPADLVAENARQGVNEETANFNKLQEQLLGLNAQASGLNREAQAIPLLTQQNLTAQGRIASSGGIAPENSAALRNNAIKALSIAAQSDIALAAAQGSEIRLNAAKDKAKQIVDIKYAQIEAELKAKQLQYDLNKDVLDRLDKKRSEALQVALKKEEQQIADAKELENGLQSLKIEIAKNGGDPSVVDGSKSLSEAINASASSLRTPNNEIKELNGSLYIIDKNTGKARLVAGGGAAGGGISSNGQGAQYAGVVNTILASGKFTKDQSNAIRNAINNGEDPVTVIKNNAKNIMGQTEATTLGKYEAAKSALADLDTSLKAYYAAGGETSLLKGKTEKVINNLGNVKDPALVELATQIAAQIQVYRNAVSGTAYSVQEGKQIDSVFPGITKTEGLNTAIIAGRNKAFDSAIDGTYRATLGGAYDQIKQASSQSSKGSKTDAQFVESSLVSKGLKYDSVINNTPDGQIPVVDNSTGQVGYIPFGEFTSSKYTKL